MTRARTLTSEAPTVGTMGVLSQIKKLMQSQLDHIGATLSCGIEESVVPCGTRVESTK
jgi:hypothetical protein